MQSNNCLYSYSNHSDPGIDQDRIYFSEKVNYYKCIILTSTIKNDFHKNLIVPLIKNIIDNQELQFKHFVYLSVILKVYLNYVQQYKKTKEYSAKDFDLLLVCRLAHYFSKETEGLLQNINYYKITSEQLSFHKKHVASLIKHEATEFADQIKLMLHQVCKKPQNISNEEMHMLLDLIMSVIKLDCYRDQVLLLKGLKHDLKSTVGYLLLDYNEHTVKIKEILEFIAKIEQMDNSKLFQNNSVKLFRRCSL